ncbi:hypothetical protein [Microcoleus sp. FACHB-672]|uniref:hypothetical protein n=1 Tax=Microcoleus sp. FACHB-672 TaxID=2692825 RepID=UPI001A7ED166|nr:hypothetical protein [Microcoleus sp. FACHB-672]
MQRPHLPALSLRWRTLESGELLRPNDYTLNIFSDPRPASSIPQYLPYSLDSIYLSLTLCDVLVIIRYLRFLIYTLDK